jgi:hypothetical protein
MRLSQWQPPLLVQILLFHRANIVPNIVINLTYITRPKSFHGMYIPQ